MRFIRETTFKTFTKGEAEEIEIIEKCRQLFRLNFSSKSQPDLRFFLFDIISQYPLSPFLDSRVENVRKIDLINNFPHKYGTDEMKAERKRQREKITSLSS